MSGKTIKLLGLTALAVLGGFFVFQDFQSQKPGVEEFPSGEVVFSELRANALIRIEVSGDSSEGFEVVRKEASISTPDGRLSDDWMLSKPIRARASQTSVAELAVAIASIRAFHRIAKVEQDPSPAAYGFSSPSAAFQLSDGKNEIRFEIGRQHPLSKRWYLRVNGRDAVYLIDDATRTRLRKSVFDLRLKKPFSFRPSEIKRMILARSEGKTLSFERVQSGSGWNYAEGWGLDEGAGEPADPAMLAKVFRQLNDLTALGFVDPEVFRPELYGFIEPKVSISLFSDLDEGVPVGDSGASTTSERLVILTKGKDGNWYFKVKGEPWVYLTKPRAYGDLLADMVHFRDRRLFRNLSPETISEVLVGERSLPAEKFEKVLSMEAVAFLEGESGSFEEKNRMLEVLVRSKDLPVPYTLEVYGPLGALGQSEGKSRNVQEKNAPRFATLQLPDGRSFKLIVTVDEVF